MACKKKSSGKRKMACGGKVGAKPKAKVATMAKGGKIMKASKSSCC